MARLDVGDKAPIFTLPADDGSSVALQQFAGQRVVLFFYPADDTPGCTREACQFNSLVTSFTKLKVQLLGVSPDNATSHLAFRKKYSLQYRLLSDEPKTVMEMYGAYGEKQLYGKTVVGVIRSTFLISPTGRIERAWYGVRTEGHAARVLSEL